MSGHFFLLLKSVLLHGSNLYLRFVSFGSITTKTDIDIFHLDLSIIVLSLQFMSLTIDVDADNMMHNPELQLLERMMQTAIITLKHQQVETTRLSEATNTVFIQWDCGETVSMRLI